MTALQLDQKIEPEGRSWFAAFGVQFPGASEIQLHSLYIINAEGTKVNSGFRKKPEILRSTCPTCPTCPFPRKRHQIDPIVVNGEYIETCWKLSNIR